MNSGPIEIYRPRHVSNLGRWHIGHLQLKAYGIAADGRFVDEAMVLLAQNFVERDVLPRVAKEGEDNGLGFVIIHAGEVGVSTLAHWWIQGSVLCQQIHRRLYSAQQPMDTERRPVIACVWELALINAEQESWRTTMMSGQANPSAYIEARPAFDVV